MQCPVDHSDMKQRNHINEAGTGIAYAYHFCERCQKSYLNNLQEIETTNRPKDIEFKDGIFKLKF